MKPRGRWILARSTASAERAASTCRPMARLLDVLREDCGLTGHQGRVRRRRVRRLHRAGRRGRRRFVSVPVAQVEGCAHRHHRGAAAEATANALQHAFVRARRRTVRHLHAGHDHGSVRARAEPRSRDEIRTALAGNLCRCTGLLRHLQRVEAAMRPAKKQAGPCPPDAGEPSSPQLGPRSLTRRRVVATRCGCSRRRRSRRLPAAPTSMSGLQLRHARRPALSRHLGARRTARHRRCAAIVLRHRRADHLHRDHPSPPCARPADACRGGARNWRRPDPEPRHHRRQHRERVAGRRHAARARRRRCRRGAAQHRVANAACRSPTSTPAIARACGRPDELITAVEIPRVEGPQWFRKVGTRAAQSISKVVMAGVRADRPRIAYGSVAPTVVRVPRTEDALAAGASIAEAQRILQEEISPIDDIRSTVAYRREVAARLLAQFWSATR